METCLLTDQEPDVRAAGSRHAVSQQTIAGRVGESVVGFGEEREVEAGPAEPPRGRCGPWLPPTGAARRAVPRPLNGGWLISRKQEYRGLSGNVHSMAEMIQRRKDAIR